MEVWLIDTLAPGSPSTLLDEHDDLGWFDLSNPASCGWTDPRRINVVVTVGTAVNAAHRPRPGAVLVAKIGEAASMRPGLLADVGRVHAPTGESPQPGASSSSGRPLWQQYWNGYGTTVHSDPRVARSPRSTGPAQWSWVDQAAWSSNTQEVGVPNA
jgi:hypothetical protein